MVRDQVLSLCDGAEAWHHRALATLDELDAQVRADSDDKRLIAPWDHFHRGLKAHFAEEEQVLFPALRKLARGELPDGDRFVVLLEEMAQELDEIRTISDALRHAARDAPELEEGILTLLDELEEHARREEEELLPAARQLLLDWQQQAAPQPTPHAVPPPRPDGGVLRRTARRLRSLLKG